MNIAEVFKHFEGTFEVDLGTKHHFSSGLYAKEMKIPAGYVAGTHAHKYDHLSILATGKVVLHRDGVKTIFTAPACITVEAGVHHMIEAIEDAVWFCLHATEETDETKIDAVLIERG